MRIRWLPEAVADLERIDAYWTEIDPLLAQRVAQRLIEMAESLKDMPDRGRPSRADPDSREIVGRFGKGAFILRYRSFEAERIVVQVRHSREQAGL
ncbi:MAG: type II toxin-antitoxin system RelE/ParE family toxin [Hyphomonas sp.]